MILDLFPFLQQALEHDVPCNDAIRDDQSIIGIGGRHVEIDIDDSLPLLDWKRFQDREQVGISLERQKRYRLSLIH